MNQNFSDERLSAYLDGELEADELIRLERELAEDPALRAELDALRESVDFLREAGPVDAPADFHSRVMARVSLLETPPTGLLDRLRALLAGVPLERLVVVLAAAMVVVILVDQPKKTPPAAPEPEAAPLAVIEPTPVPEPIAEEPVVPTPTAPRLAAREAEPAPVPISDERNDVLDEIIGSPVADRDGVALAPTGTPETTTTAVEQATSDAMRASVTLRVTTDDPLVMQQLSQLAGQFQGSASAANGAPLSTQRLSQPGMVPVRVRIPASQLNNFQMKARGLGKVEVMARQNTALYGTAPVDVLVEVDYRP